MSCLRALATVLFASLCLPCIAPLFGLQPDTTESLLQNGGFREWRQDRPFGWEVTVGATSNNSRIRSKLVRAEGPSLQLQGDADTGVWQLVSQTIRLEQETPYFVEAEARGIRLRREGNQFDNSYVGIFLKTGEGQSAGQVIAQVDHEDYRSHVLPFKTSRIPTMGQVSIFLSKSGRLRVRHIELKRVTLANSFDLLVADMDRHYSRFAHLNLDWQAICSKHRERGQRVQTSNQLVDVLADILAELNDVHVWIVHRGQRRDVARTGYQPNFDFKVVDRDLRNLQPLGPLGMVSRTRDGFGYLRITSLPDVDASNLAAVKQKIRPFLDAPGVIVDLRANRGGSEPFAQCIAGLFTDNPVVYARQKFRSGFSHEDFTETAPRVLQPSNNPVGPCPLVCLIGPGTVSSGEAFAAMMSALPDCTLVGLPTRGASGNPQPIHLGGDVTVFYSRWLSMMPDGSSIEGVGVQPDETIRHQPGHDPAYQRAVEILLDRRRP